MIPKTVEQDHLRIGAEFFQKNPAGWRDSVRLYKERLAQQILPQIKRRNARGFMLQQKDKALTTSLQGAPPYHLLRINEIHGIVHAGMAALLIIGSYFLLLIVFDPFPIKRAYVHGFAAGLAVVTAGFTYWVAEAFARKLWLQFSMASTGLGVSILASLFLASVRALQFGTLIQTAAVSGADPGDVTAVAHAFYLKSVPLLQIALPLLSLAFELGAGLYLHSALERLLSPDLAAYRKLETVQRQLVQLHTELENLKALPDSFERIATIGALNAQNGTVVDNSAEKRLAIILPIAFLLLIAFALAVVRSMGAEQGPPSSDVVVILIDLTKSVDAKDGGGSSAYDKYRVAGEWIISELGKPGTSVTAIGITDDSFSRPLMLVQERIGTDPGYFGEKLQASRRRLITKWRQQTGTRRPSFARTDLLGAFEQAAEIVKSQQGRSPVLVVLSDMRHITRQLDIETPDHIDVAVALNRVQRQRLIPNLNGVLVYVLGAQCAKRDYSYFRGLEEFWTGYFKAAGGQLRVFTNQTEARIQ